MSNKVRFGKYGESKRLERLRAQRLANPRGRVSQTGPVQAFPARPRKTEKIRVRQAAAGDVEFVTSLSREAFSQYGPYDELLRSFLEEGACLCFVASHKGVRCGFIMLGDSRSEAGSAEAEVLAVAVSPRMRRRGAASALLERAEQALRSAGLGRILLHTGVDNTLAQAFFKAMGFSPIGVKPAFYPMGQAAIAMTKPLL